MRVTDGVVVTIAMILMATPFLPSVWAASDGAVIEAPMSVEQKVKSSSMISKPTDGHFDVDHDGKSLGTVNWDVFTTDTNGFKLVLSSTSSPAMRDMRGNSDIDDYSDSPTGWSVSGEQRRFGFSAVGARAMSEFGGGRKWRGFDGLKGIEIARRRGSATAETRTTVRLASEMGNALPAGARPRAAIIATVVANI